MVAKATTTVLCMTGINTVNGFFFLNVKFSLNNKNLNIFQFCTKLVSLDEVCSQTVSKAGKETVLPEEPRDSVSLRVTTRRECVLHSLRWLRLCQVFTRSEQEGEKSPTAGCGFVISAPRSFSREETITLMEILPKGVHDSPLWAQLILETS